MFFQSKMPIAGALMVASAPLVAQDSPATDAPAAPAVYRAVIACEDIAEPAQRLACFDRNVAALKAAAAARQVVVVDRTTIREARRGIFGLKLPRLKLFDDDQDGAQEIVSIDSTISGVRMAKDGMPIFVLADGARWKQTEGRNVFARSGQPIHIKRAAMGSYMANVNKQAGVRVVRLAD